MCWACVGVMGCAWGRAWRVFGRVWGVGACWGSVGGLWGCVGGCVRCLCVLGCGVRGEEKVSLAPLYYPDTLVNPDTCLGNVHLLLFDFMSDFE